jgi:hypothetical protein
VHERDAGQCTFTDDHGNRCPERAVLEFDHIHPALAVDSLPSTTCGYDVERKTCFTRSKPTVVCSWLRSFPGHRKRPTLLGKHVLSRGARWLIVDLVSRGSGTAAGLARDLLPYDAVPYRNAGRAGPCALCEKSAELRCRHCGHALCRTHAVTSDFFVPTAECRDQQACDRPAQRRHSRRQHSPTFHTIYDPSELREG